MKQQTHAPTRSTGTATTRARVSSGGSVSAAVSAEPTAGVEEAVGELQPGAAHSGVVTRLLAVCLLSLQLLLPAATPCVEPRCALVFWRQRSCGVCGELSIIKRRGAVCDAGAHMLDLHAQRVHNSGREESGTRRAECIGMSARHNRFHETPTLPRDHRDAIFGRGVCAIHSSCYASLT